MSKQREARDRFEAMWLARQEAFDAIDARETGLVLALARARGREPALPDFVRAGEMMAYTWRRFHSIPLGRHA
ncbi:hypothetical protein [Bradyrhizobium sp. USDA 4508]